MKAQGKSALVRITRLIGNWMTVFTVIALVGVTAAEAANVTLRVISARSEPKAFGGTGVAKGALVTSYKYIINVDNTGTTEQRSPAPGTGCSPQDAGYPGSCKWTSIAGVPGSSPIYTQGNQADFSAPMNIPDGRYLISVLADGYKLDGRHFTVDSTKTPNVTWQGKAPSDGTLAFFKVHELVSVIGIVICYAVYCLRRPCESRINQPVEGVAKPASSIET